MAALLVALAVMSVLMSVATPAWRQLVRREKEAELVFRGEQYARAIALYRAKTGNQFPPSIDVLVQGRFLRKKYKDPMTPDGEFRLVYVGNPQADAGRGGNPPQGRGSTAPPGLPPPGLSTPGLSTPGQTGTIGGGIMGVASKSTETSIRTYKGQTRYDLWPFTFNLVNRPGGSMPGANTPGVGPGRGQPMPGGPGRGGRGPGRGEGPGPGRGFGPGRGLGPFLGPDGQPLTPVPAPAGRGRGGGRPSSD